MSNLAVTGSFAHAQALEDASTSLGRMIASVIGAIITHVRKEKTRRQLMELDDHMLRDIGLSRSDLHANRLEEMNRINWSAKGHPAGL